MAAAAASSGMAIPGLAVSTTPTRSLTSLLSNQAAAAALSPSPSISGRFHLTAAPLAAAEMRCVYVLLVCMVLVTSGGHAARAERFFAEIVPTSEMWSARFDAALEWVPRTTTFRDGVQSGRSVTLTNYSLLYGGNTESGPVNDGKQHGSTTAILCSLSAAQLTRLLLRSLPACCVCAVWASTNGRRWVWVAGSAAEAAAHHQRRLSSLRSSSPSLLCCAVSQQR
jgi:hypothetical protein